MSRGLQVAALVTLVVLLLPATSAAQSPDLPCDPPYRVEQQLPGGASWHLCWEPREREGVVLHQVYYAPPAGAPERILAQLGLSQLHVPYDDNGARFHDLSDFGLGGANLNHMTTSDCPAGQLLDHDGKAAVCLTTSKRGLAYRTAEGDSAQGHMLELFSVSHVGAYNYIPLYRFFDDGTVEIAIGATGRLQRRTTDAAANPHGWILDSRGRIGLSHMHNYFWRIDPDLGTTGSDDIIEESNRSQTPRRFSQEVARQISPRQQRTWRILDSGTGARPRSYEIELLETGHREKGPAFEPFTHSDLYVTEHKACERFASHNASNGCADDVSEFVNGETLTDPVLFVGLSFHHIPRDEDEPLMDVHWNRFRLVPRDMHSRNPIVPDNPSNEFPTLERALPQQNLEGDTVSYQLTGHDVDGDTLTFAANGLPPGLTINPSTGLISGALDYESAGTYLAYVTVTDGALSDAVGFTWLVRDNNRPPAVRHPGDQTVRVGEPVSLQIVASDADGDPLRYIAFDLPPGLTIDEHSGLITGTPTAIGDSIVAIEVRDGKNVPLIWFRFTVTGTGNRAPVVTAVRNRTDRVGDGITLPIEASDPEGAALTYSAHGLPARIRIDPVTGVLSGTLEPGAGDLIHHPFIRVSDGQATTSISWAWTVLAADNRPPKIRLLLPQYTRVEWTVNLYDIATDPDGDDLQFSAAGLPPGIGIDPVIGTISGQHPLGSEGTYTVTVTVSDGQLTRSASFVWIVQPKS